MARLADMMAGLVGFVVITIAVSVGAFVISQTQQTLQVENQSLHNLPANAMSNASVTGIQNALNVTNGAIGGLNQIATFLPLLAIIIVAVVIISLLGGFMKNNVGFEEGIRNEVRNMGEVIHYAEQRVESEFKPKKFNPDDYNIPKPKRFKSKSSEHYDMESYDGEQYDHEEEKNG